MLVSFFNNLIAMLKEMNLNELGYAAHKLPLPFMREPLSPSIWDDGGDLESLNLMVAHVSLVQSDASRMSDNIFRQDFEAFQLALADVMLRVSAIGYGLGIDVDDLVRRRIAALKPRS